jgi:predicted RecB family endonuclease
MATTVSAFNDMMQQFLDELVLTFPEEKSFVKYQATFSMIRKARPRSILENYMKSIGPVATQLMEKNESFFKENSDSVPLLSDLNLAKIWTDDLSQTTKEAIWKYLQTLYILATTITALPAETLSMIESVAEKCAKQMSEEGLSSEEALMKNMSGLMAQLMGPTGGLGAKKISE